MRIYVAPGHGLTPSGQLDPGAVSGHEVEHTLNRAVAAAYASALTRCGVQVVYEAEPDPDYIGSVARANAAGVDCGDEVHHDAGGGHGTSILYHPATTPANKACAVRMAALVSAAVGLPNRGAIPRPDLYWLNATRFPALLPECAFVDGDQAVIDSPGYAAKVGEALARARCEYAGVAYRPPPQGPYTHEVRPGDPLLSFAALAASRGMTVARLADLARSHLTGGDLAIFNAYLALDAALTAAGHPHPFMPTGFCWVSLHP